MLCHANMVRFVRITLLAVLLGSTACVAFTAALVVYTPTPTAWLLSPRDWSFDANKRVLFWISLDKGWHSRACVSFRVFDSLYYVNRAHAKREWWSISESQAAEFRQSPLPPELNGVLPPTLWTPSRSKPVVYVETFGFPLRCLDLGTVATVNPPPRVPTHSINAGSKRAFDTAHVRWATLAANLAIFSAAAWLPTFAIVAVVRAMPRRMRVRRSLCGTCAHPVLPAQAVCPECGTPVVARTATC